jgi:hypothetical protein
MSKNERSDIGRMKEKNVAVLWDNRKPKFSKNRTLDHYVVMIALPVPDTCIYRSRFTYLNKSFHKQSSVLLRLSERRSFHDV